MCGARATFQEEWRLLEASDALVMGHRHGCRGLAELMYAPVCHRDIVPELLYRGVLFGGLADAITESRRSGAALTGSP